MKLFRRRKLKKLGIKKPAKRKSDQKHPLVQVFERGVLARNITMLLSVILMTLLLVAGGHYRRPKLSLGQTVEEDIRTSIDFRYKDENETRRLQEERAKQIPKLYRADLTKIRLVIGDIRKKVSEAAGTTASDTQSVADIQRKAESALRRTIDIDSWNARRLITNPYFNKILKTVEQGFADHSTTRFFKEVSEVKLEAGGFNIKSSKDFRRSLDRNVALALANIGGEAIRLAEVLNDTLLQQIKPEEDAELQKQLLAKARASVSQQFTEMKTGERIIRKGEIVTTDHMVQLKAMEEELNKHRSLADRWLYVVGISMVVVLVTVVCYFYFKLFQRDIFVNNILLIFTASLVLISVGLSKIFIIINPITPFLQYPVFTVFGSLITVMVFNIHTALFVTILISLFIGIVFGNNVSYLMVSLIGGFCAAFYGHRIRRRGEFIKTGLAAGLAGFVMIVSFGAITGVKMPALMYQAIGGAAFGGMAGLFAAGALPIYEYIFGVITNISLMELSDSNHPLLKRLVMETPGTYHHSLIVGNLSEAASEAVDANPLLARVGSYFHDIGKLKKPLYFAENEQFSKSRHDSLLPSMSSLIIISHVKEGIDLARQYKLNRKIIDIIKQHHGTSLVYYFYHRAAELIANGEKIDEGDFRYLGPKPQSREAAIIMLADSVEAASRSLEKPNAARIEALVKNIIDRKFKDAQLDDCNLTFRDLHTISRVFTQILLGTLHPRVKYPEEGKKSDTSAKKPQSGNENILQKPTESASDGLA